MPHAISGSERFSTRPFGKKSTGTLLQVAVYADLTSERYRTETYAEMMMEMTVDIFGKCTTEQPEKVIDKHRVEEKTWIVPAAFSAMLFFNNENCFPTEKC